ncbi:hypothetical protein L7F22_034618 [Adiantum nelumboides]|nr:hypothetical protein [Adiantum nelumboides]
MHWFILCFVLLASCRRSNAGLHVSNTATYDEGRLILLPRKSSPSSFSLCQQSSSTSSSQPFARHKLPGGAFVDLCLEALGRASGSEIYAGVKAIELERKLVGSGAHRELQSSITVTLEKSEECHMVIVERLSSGVFADMFELQNLVARAVYKEAAIYGDHNLELPALLSYESMVVVHTSFKTMSGHPTQAQVSLPLHARYPSV